MGVHCSSLNNPMASMVLSRRTINLFHCKWFLAIKLDFGLRHSVSPAYVLMAYGSSCNNLSRVRESRYSRRTPRQEGWVNPLKKCAGGVFSYITGLLMTTITIMYLCMYACSHSLTLSCTQKMITIVFRMIHVN